MGQIVKYHSDVNKINFSLFKEKDYDLFFSLLFKFRDKGIQEETLTFSELKQITEYKRTDRFLEDLEGLYDKLLSTTFKIEDEESIEKFTIFSRYKIYKKDEKVTIQVHERFRYILNDLPQFTLFDLKEFVQLKGIYSKLLFKLLKQWESKKQYMVTIEEFRLILGIPDSYKISDIDKRVLNCIDELKKSFPSLKVTKIKRGREISSLKFTWKAKPKEKEKENMLTSKEKQLKETGVYVKPSCSYEESEEAQQIRKDIISEADKPILSFTKEEEEMAIKILCEEKGVSLTFLKNLKQKMESAYIHTVKEALKNKGI